MAHARIWESTQRIRLSPLGSPQLHRTTTQTQQAANSKMGTTANKMREQHQIRGSEHLLSNSTTCDSSSTQAKKKLHRGTAAKNQGETRRSLNRCPSAVNTLRFNKKETASSIPLQRNQYLTCQLVSAAVGYHLTRNEFIGCRQRYPNSTSITEVELNQSNNLRGFEIISSE